MESDSSQKAGLLGILFAWLVVVAFWGTSFMAARFALRGLPPILLDGVRFYAAGTLLFLIAIIMGYRFPRPKEWISGMVIGTIMLAVSSGALIFGEPLVKPRLLIIGLATMPLWTLLFSGVLLRRPGFFEWLGMVMGLGGIAVLNMNVDLNFNMAGAGLIVLSAMSWALGSTLFKKLPMPQGPMAPAVAMLAAGLVLIAGGHYMGERIQVFPTFRPSAAIAYLIVSSVLAFSAHAYLLRWSRPLVANSFAFTSPLMAIGLGVALIADNRLGVEMRAQNWLVTTLRAERLSDMGLIAIAVVLGGVLLLAIPRRQK